MSWQVLDPIPEGVIAIREYPSLHATLVQCVHPVGARHESFGRPACRTCKGDVFTTSEFALPVKFMAVLPAGQASLFG